MLRLNGTLRDDYQSFTCISLLAILDISDRSQKTYCVLKGTFIKYLSLGTLGVASSIKCKEGCFKVLSGRVNIWMGDHPGDPVLHVWGSQVAVVFYISASHLCNRTSVEFQSISTEGFSPRTLVFLALQNRVPVKNMRAMLQDQT